MRLWAIGPAVRSSGLSAGDRALAALEALGRYGAMLVDALRPNIQQGYLGVSSWPYVAAGVVVAVLLALGALRVLRQSDDALEVGSWLTFLCALGLVLHVVPITVNVVAADRFAYLPFAALIVGTLPALAARLPRARSVAAAALVIVASFGVVTFARCHVWADEVTFWTRAFHGKATFDTMSRVELGNVYFRAGMHRHALALYFDADEGDYFNHVMAMHNAGNALLLGGRYADARRLLSQVVEREPNTPKFRVALAVAHIANLDFDSASREIDRALALYPTFEDARQLKRALPKVRDSVSRLTAPPRDNPERLTYAQIFAELERHPDAFQLLKEALRRPAPERPGVSDLRRSVLYALQFADVATLREVFESYEHHTADPPLAGIRHAVRERFERVERLRALWPSLGVPLR